MKSLVKNTITFLVALTGLIGGILWAIKTNWEGEPTILIIVSLIEIIGYFILKNINEDNSPIPNYSQ